MMKEHSDWSDEYFKTIGQGDNLTIIICTSNLLKEDT
jgi:hypothetical protein